MTPNPRPIPRFIADSTQEGIPHGRFVEKLAAPFREAVGTIEDLPEGVEPPERIDWFPERTWGGRTWVPCSALVDGPEGKLELFGQVSYARGPAGDDQAPDREGNGESPTGDPTDFRATADFTDVLAADNPEWRIDINDEVIGRWRGENGRAGKVTLVWGRPLVRGAVAATAELDGETVDQEAISDQRFTLIALDALEAYGDDVFLEVKLWSRRGQELAAESLYA